MCVGVPMEVIEVNEEENYAVVELGGTKRTVRLDIVDRMPKVGDFLIVHAGFAIYCLDKAEAEFRLSLFEQAFAYEKA